MKTAYQRNRLARLFVSWITSRTRNEKLHDAVFSFLESVIPREDLPEEEGFPSGKEQKTERFDLLLEKLAPMAAEIIENPAMDKLEKRSGLTPLEARLLEFLYLYLSCRILADYCKDLPEWDLVDRIASYCGASEEETLAALRTDGVLMRSGLGRKDGCTLRIKEVYDITFGLTDPAMAYIASEGKRSLASILLDRWKGTCLPLSDFDFPEITKTAALACLTAARGKPVLLLSGKPGTGKTEFARSLCKASKLEPYFLRQDPSLGEKRFSEMLLAARLVDPVKEVIVVDEADEILNLNSYFSSFARKDLDKGMVNDFLDGTDARMIFITNEKKDIPDSILRRFSFHLQFEDFGPTQRLRVWNALCKQSALFSESDVKTLAFQYQANSARIRQVVDVCGSFMQSQGLNQGCESLAVAQDMLSRSDEIMYKIPLKKSNRIPVYDPRFLNTDIPEESLIESLEAWKNRGPGFKYGINLLFYGVPGTGKTAFARHLAERLGQGLIIKVASDFLSPWVGETEEKIRKAFQQGEGQILVIDEADTFLTDRSRAFRSWERSMTNEILNAMENFRGMFIASTNFRSILDSACLRRFTYKIEFRPTVPEKRFDLVAAYIPGIEWNDEERLDLERLGGITPGDVAVAAMRINLAGDATPSRILSALREEVSARRYISQEKIGF